MLKNKIDKKRAELETLLSKETDFKTREAELEEAIAEANSEDEQQIVSENIEQFEKDKGEYDNEKARLQGEISDLESELEEAEKEPPKEINKERVDKRMDKTINIRSLPMNIRAFDAIPFTDREAFVKRDDVKDFLTRLREFGHNKRAVTGAELAIPVVMLDLIAENMYRYSKLINRVRVRNIRGEARQTIAGTVPEAVWTEMCGAINELNFVFNQVTLDGYKVAGYVPVCNSLLEDTDIELASWLIEMIAEAIGLAKDKAILYGKGGANKMPLGIVTRLAQESKPSDYPANAPEWVDLHESNILKIGGSTSTGAAFWAALVEAIGNTSNPYARGSMFWAMNSKTYATLKSKLITFTATGDIVANLFGTLPVVSGDVDILEFMPDGDIVGGYGDLYLWVERSSMTIDSSEHVQFIQDNTVFRGKERADGMPIIPGAFVAININNQNVTTVMNFAADTANDADLETLTIGSETLAPTFTSSTQTYSVTASATSDKVEANAAQASAQIAIEYEGKNYRNGATITWVADSTAHPLTITVKNGNAVKVYTVNVTKASA